MRTLAEHHDLPDFTTKRGLKECYNNMEIIPPLMVTADAPTGDVHLAAAAHMHLSMVAVDAMLGEELGTFPGLNYSIAEALRSQCDLRVMAGLFLLLKLIPHVDFGCLEDLASDVIPLVLNLIVTTKVENLVLELSLDSWTQWAVLLYLHDSDSGYLVINFMERLAMACRHTNRRQIASHILRQLQHVTCSTDVLSNEEEDADGMRRFFIAALRYDSAGDRLLALRAFRHTFARHVDDSPDGNAYPVTHMTAADYTHATGETHFHGLDTTRSDAKRVLDLRAEFFDCMRIFCSSRDTHTLAESLHDLLLRDPRAVGFSPDSVQQFARGRAPSQCQPSFVSWSDTLRHCTDSLRTCSRPSCGSHRQAVHILELQNYILDHKAHVAARVAAKLVESSDTPVLWYLYALAHGADRRGIYTIVRAVKDLITAESPVTKTPLYECMLATTALSAFSYVLTGDLEAWLPNNWDNVTTFGRLAAWAAMEYLRSAPFDGQYVAAMNEVYLLYHIWKEPSSSSTNPSPSTRFPFEARWNAATTIHSRVWNRPTVPHLHAMVTTLYADYAHAVSMWSTVLDHHLTRTPAPSPTDALDDFTRGDIYMGKRSFTPEQVAAWRSLISGEGAASCRARRVCWRDAPVETLKEVMQVHYTLRMHSCGHCGIDSTVLRRCGACKAIRYCGRDCQAEDWRQDHQHSCPRTYA
ncbi:hypothetical protein AURDEDRAFT_114308 [Auricularia subglabra TFB-10046 SS5]|uniref:MYND-type domain-containing protein n=1 Tax=Auricularia subglabra (strain TFB-10046 / SS5) TaxID=717982 RepID=J0WZ96_AURST|nr:hypothetical protein AURDEDRAFT_114308 [Auricularia subglabra TFB-10046 SS5]